MSTKYTVCWRDTDTGQSFTRTGADERAAMDIWQSVSLYANTELVSITPASVNGTSLPQEPEQLWDLLAQVLTALEGAGEGPELEEGRDWRTSSREHTPGIRRTAPDGRWRRMVEWTNSSGVWRWTYKAS